MTISLRCPKRYSIRNQEEQQCVKQYDHEGGCQLTLWWALKVPPLEVGIGTVIESSDVSIRRLK